jgi:tetratricopeptide (TPR) repeat protein
MRRLLVSCVLGLTLVSFGCARSNPAVRYGEASTGNGKGPLSDADFGRALDAMLSAEPQSQARARSVEAVMQKQFAYAGYRFRTRNPASGAGKLAGAFSLLRTGEMRESLLGPFGYDTLRSASREYSKRGDEGRAEATFGVLSKTGPAEQQNDAKEHLAAIKQWNGSFQTAGLAGAGTAANSAVVRYLSDVSETSLRQAIALTEQWLARAVSLRDNFRSTMVAPPRADAIEAQRALAIAPSILAGLHIRNYDAGSALAVLERSEARTPTRALSSALASVNKNANAENWLSVARALRGASAGTSGGGNAGGEGDNESDGSEDMDIVKSASFSAALEAYRLDRENPYAALEVAIRLREFGFAHAAPSVLVAAATKTLDAQFLSAALTVTLACIKSELQDDDPNAARRAYVSGRPLLELTTQVKQRIPQVPARILGLVGEIQARDGDLDGAMAYYQASNKLEPSASVTASIARVLAHRGKMDDAIATLTRAKAQVRGADLVELLIQLADVHIAKQNPKAARACLLEALTVLAVRGPGIDSVERERATANIMMRFGARDAARRSLLLALDQATRDKKVLGDVVGPLPIRWSRAISTWRVVRLRKPSMQTPHR